MFLDQRHPTEQHEILDGIVALPGGSIHPHQVYTWCWNTTFHYIFIYISDKGVIKLPIEKFEVVGAKATSVHSI